MKFSKFFSDLYTGPDGETWQIGRVYSVPILITGLAAPILAIVRSSPDHSVSLGDVGLELGGLATAIAALVALTKNVDNVHGTALSAPTPGA